MKNVISISVKSLCLFCMFAICGVNAQEMASLSNMQKETITIQRAEKVKGIQETYVVKGSVLDQDNLPLGGVNVVLKGTRDGVVSDIDGKFEFSRALNADDILIFSYIGYNPQEYRVVADASQNMDVKINFDLSDISLMGAVEVEGVYKSKKNIFQKFIGLFK